MTLPERYERHIHAYGRSGIGWQQAEHYRIRAMIAESALVEANKKIKALEDQLLSASPALTACECGHDAGDHAYSSQHCQHAACNCERYFAATLEPMHFWGKGRATACGLTEPRDYTTNYAIVTCSACLSASPALAHDDHGHSEACFLGTVCANPSHYAASPAPQRQDDHEDPRGSQREAYRVEVEAGGCERCSAGKEWSVVGPDGYGIGISYLQQEDAEDTCGLLNAAHFFGMEAARGQEQGAVTDEVAAVDRVAPERPQEALRAQPLDSTTLPPTLAQEDTKP